MKDVCDRAGVIAASRSSTSQVFFERFEPSWRKEAVDDSDIAKVNEGRSESGFLSGDENSSCQMSLLTDNGDKILREA